MQKNLPIIVDGPNFINRLIDLPIDNDIISNQLSLSGLRSIVESEINKIIKVKISCEVVEFVCSKKLFGTSAKKFSKEERDKLVKSFMQEIGVYVEEVDIPGTSEKGVDNTIATKIETFLEQNEAIILVSEDRDFIPLLRKMRERGKKIFVVALKDNYPIEITNQAYATINLIKLYPYLFDYSYKVHYINQINVEMFRIMLANSDDSKHNQLRVTYSGKIFFSNDFVGNQELKDIKFRFETYAAFNGYVGPVAASDKDYVGRRYKELITAWENDLEDCIDFPIDR